MENDRNGNGNAQGNDRAPTQSTGELHDRLKRAETEIERLRERLVEFEKTIRENSRDKKSGPRVVARGRRFKSPPAALASARRP